MDISLCMPDYIMIHTFTSVFLHYRFEKVKMKLFHWPTGQKGEEKVTWSIMIHELLQDYIYNISELYFKYLKNSFLRKKVLSES